MAPARRGVRAGVHVHVHVHLRDVVTLFGWASVMGVVALIGFVGVGGAIVSDAPPAGATPPATLDTVVIPNLGPGYSVTSQGPLDAAQFASDAPDPSAAAGALSTLGKSISTYERVWQADGGLNQVQDLLVRFADTVGAKVFVQAAQHSLQSGEIVSSDPVPSIPGARRVTYFAATNQSGVGEAISMRAGVYVDLLSFFSAASGNAQPISPANAEKVAQTQYVAMTKAPGGAAAEAAGGGGGRGGGKKGVTSSTILLALIPVAVLSLAVAAPVLLRRRRTYDPATAIVLPTARSADGAGVAGVAGGGGGGGGGGGTVDDFSEHSG